MCCRGCYRIFRRGRGGLFLLAKVFLVVLIAYILIGSFYMHIPLYGLDKLIYSCMEYLPFDIPFLNRKNSVNMKRGNKYGGYNNKRHRQQNNNPSIMMNLMNHVPSQIFQVLYYSFIVLLVYLLLRLITRIIFWKRRKNKVFSTMDWILHLIMFDLILDYKEKRTTRLENERIRRRIEDIKKTYDERLNFKRSELEVAFEKKRKEDERDEKRKRESKFEELSHILNDKETEISNLRSSLRESREKVSHLILKNEMLLEKNEKNGNDFLEQKRPIPFYGTNEEAIKKIDDKNVLKDWISMNNETMKQCQEKCIGINYQIQTRLIILDEMKKKNDTKEEDDRKLCPICLDKEKNICLSPCGHLLCEDCKDLVQKCPICRAEIKDRIRKYE